MLNFINHFLLLGAPSQDEWSAWPLALATVLAATMILNRQHRG